MSPLAKQRITSIDLLRGLVMMIMALDHARDFTHLGFFSNYNPLDFSTTTTPLFLTRWITHFCAPVFVFLAGASIFFSGANKTKNELALFLLTRGLWLMVLELTIVGFGWMFSIEYKLVFLQVIWVIGLSMVCMSAIIYLPRILIFIAGLVIVFGHNLLDEFHITDHNLQGLGWNILHDPGTYKLAEGHTLFIAYPLVPWVGLMMLGYVFGTFYVREVNEWTRRNRLIALGLGCIVLFIILRSGNFYGDAHHWAKQKTQVFTALSFVDTTKYPPSLLYLLMTIGPALMFLAFAEKLRGKVVTTVSVFGRVPLFFYVLHIYLLHIIAGIIFFATGHTLGEINFDADVPEIPGGFGLHLWQVYLVWMLSLVLLYFPCKWYNDYKSTHRYWWLSYL